MTLRIATFLCLLAITANAETLPPKQSTDQRFELVAIWDGDGGIPTAFQWYRGTKTKPLAVAIPAPEGQQQTLTLRPPFTAGIYVCVMTNPVGSAMTRQTQVSITKVVTALPVVVTFKQP